MVAKFSLRSVKFPFFEFESVHPRLTAQLSRAARSRKNCQHHGYAAGRALRPVRHVASPGANRTLQPRQRKHGEHSTNQFMEQLLSACPKSLENPASILAACPADKLVAALVPLIVGGFWPPCLRSPLYFWPVNRLETTPCLALVSNLVQSYNRQ
jgi:hypothetical protein